MQKKVYKTANIIFKYLQPYRKELFILGFFSIFSAAANALVPLLAGRIFDNIVEISQNKTIAFAPVFTIIGVWLAARFAADLFDWRIENKRNEISTILHAEYTAQGFSRLLQMPMAFHKKHKHGEVTEKIDRAADWLEDIVNQIFIQLAPQFLSIIAALTITFTINFKLSLVLIIALSIYIFILRWSLPDLAVLQTKAHGNYSRAYGRAFDVLGNIREIKQATTEKIEEKFLFRNFVKKAARTWIKLNIILEKLRGWQKILITLTQLSIFIYSIFLIQNGEITPGELVAFNGYAAMFFGPFVIIGSNWANIQNGFIAIKKAEEILTLPTEVYHPRKAVIIPQLKGDVTFENVSFGYEKKQKILENISFSVKAGEVAAFVGKSGIGKTTIIDLLQGFYFPTRGRILIDGEDLKKLDLKAYRRQLAVVPQEVTLFNDTILKNILYGSPDKSAKDAEQAARLAHAAEFIESFPKKYKQLVGRRGIKLSSGQKQRIAIARAILRNPKILILDEPTSALDAESEKYIKESFRELMRGRTTFIIAHRLSTIREADQIFVIEKGKIIESGRHEELIKKPDGAYRKLYELQTRFY